MTRIEEVGDFVHEKSEELLKEEEEEQFEEMKTTRNTILDDQATRKD